MSISQQRQFVEWTLLHTSNLPAGVIRDVRKWESALDRFARETPPIVEWLDAVAKSRPRKALLLYGPNGTGKTTLAAYLMLRLGRRALWGDIAQGDLGQVETAFTCEPGSWKETVYIQAKIASMRLSKTLHISTPRPTRLWVWYENWPGLAERILALPIMSPTLDDSITRAATIYGMQCVSLLVLDDIDSGAETEMREALLRRFVDWGHVICIANAPSPEPEELVRVVGDRIMDRFGDSSRWSVVYMGGDSKRR